MTISFINSLQSEWIKKKRSLASWLVIIGSLFVPLIIIIIRLAYPDKLHAIYGAPDFWERHWRSCWESMALFLLPVGLMLATSLTAQIEYRNNTWKQLHTTPLSLTTIYFSKLSVILLMMLQFFILFNICIYASAIIPWLFISNVPFPTEDIHYMHFLKENARYFIDCLPIVGLQFVISLQYKNFMISIGTGFLLWVGSLGSLVWKYAYIIPYTYCMYNYLKDEHGGKAAIPAINIHILAMAYFGLITLVGFVLYCTKNEKG